MISRCKRVHALCAISMLRDYVRTATVISRNKKKYNKIIDTNKSERERPISPYFHLYTVPPLLVTILPLPKKKKITVRVIIIDNAVYVLHQRMTK